MLRGEEASSPEPRWTQLLYSCPPQRACPHIILNVYPPVLSSLLPNLTPTNRPMWTQPFLLSPFSGSPQLPGRLHGYGPVNSDCHKLLTDCKRERLKERGWYYCLWLWDLRMSWVRCNGGGKETEEDYFKMWISFFQNDCLRLWKLFIYYLIFFVIFYLLFCS